MYTKKHSIPGITVPYHRFAVLQLYGFAGSSGPSQLRGCSSCLLAVLIAGEFSASMTFTLTQLILVFKEEGSEH